MKNTAFEYEYPISEDLTVVIRADSFEEFLKKIGLKHDDTLRIKDADYWACDYVSRKLSKLAFDYVREKEAESRMLLDGVIPCNVPAVVDWCWKENAGRWLDGSPITDD